MDEKSCGKKGCKMTIGQKNVRIHTVEVCFEFERRK
jgi:hypothetical protein